MLNIYESSHEGRALVYLLSGRPKSDGLPKRPGKPASLIATQKTETRDSSARTRGQSE